MKLERLQSIPESAIAFDTETHIIRPGLLAPPMVCVVGRLTPGAEGFEDVDRKPTWAKNGLTMRIDEEGNPR